MYPVFADEVLVYMFYCLLLDQHRHPASTSRILNPNRRLYGKLLKRLEKIDANRPQEMNDGEISNKDASIEDVHTDADQIVKKFQLKRIFRFQCNYDFEDSDCIVRLQNLFINRNQYPSARVCIEKLHTTFTEHYDLKCKFPFIGILASFLDHFTKAEGDVLKNGFIEFVKSVHTQNDQQEA